MISRVAAHPATTSLHAASAHAADAVLGDVVRAARRASTDRGLLVVATADHGFHLGDHGVWSKQTLFDASLRVPLVISGAGVAPGVVDAPAETTGILRQSERSAVCLFADSILRIHEP